MLTTDRKKRGKKKPEGLCTVEEMKTFEQKSSHPVSKNPLYSQVLLVLGSSQLKRSGNIGARCVRRLKTSSHRLTTPTLYLMNQIFRRS